jgi:hypothetical protein
LSKRRFQEHLALDTCVHKLRREMVEFTTELVGIASENPPGAADAECWPVAVQQESMPLVPLVDLALVPLAQMPPLAPLTLWVTDRWADVR